MSLTSFLGKILKKIAALFNSIPADLQQAVHIGVVVTENLKNFVDSPGADILTAIIPGEIDDAIKQKLRFALPRLLVLLKLTETYAPADVEEIVAQNVRAFQRLDTAVAPAFLHSLSVLITQVAADGKISWSDAVYLVEWYYQNKVKASA